ncbi:MAG: hypothetical protein J6K20_03685 [Thermoguttaceae bacterium]|nr:hypothetical protein [Thermoguttaceae bacterium]
MTKIAKTGSGIDRKSAKKRRFRTSESGRTRTGTVERTSKDGANANWNRRANVEGRGEGEAEPSSERRRTGRTRTGTGGDANVVGDRENESAARTTNA